MFNWKKAPEYSFYRYAPHLSPRIVEITKPGKENKIKQLREYLSKKEKGGGVIIQDKKSDKKIDFGKRKVTGNEPYKAGLMVAPASNIKESDMIEYDPAEKKDLVKDLLSVNQKNIHECFGFIKKYGLLGVMLNWRTIFGENKPKNENKKLKILPRRLNIAGENKIKPTVLIDSDKYFKMCGVCAPNEIDLNLDEAIANYKTFESIYIVNKLFENWAGYGELVGGYLDINKDKGNKKIFISWPKINTSNILNILSVQNFSNYVCLLKQMRYPEGGEFNASEYFCFVPRIEALNSGVKLNLFPQTLADYCALKIGATIRCIICGKYVPRKNAPNALTCNEHNGTFNSRISQQKKSFFKWLNDRINDGGTQTKYERTRNNWPTRDLAIYFHPAERRPEWPLFDEFLKRVDLAKRVKMTKEEFEVVKEWLNQRKSKKSDYLKNFISNPDKAMQNTFENGKTN